MQWPRRTGLQCPDPQLDIGRKADFNDLAVSGDEIDARSRLPLGSADQPDSRSALDIQLILRQPTMRRLVRARTPQFALGHRKLTAQLDILRKCIQQDRYSLLVLPLVLLDDFQDALFCVAMIYLDLGSANPFQPCRARQLRKIAPQPLGGDRKSV